MIILVAVLSERSADMLFRTVEGTGSRTYADVGKAALGPWGAKLVDLIILLLNFGLCTSYVVVVGDLLPQVFALISPHFFLAQRIWLLMILGAALFLPLSVQRSLDRLRFTSIVAFVLVLVFAGMVAVLGFLSLCAFDSRPLMCLLSLSLALSLSQNLFWGFLLRLLLTAKPDIAPKGTQKDPIHMFPDSILDFINSAPIIFTAYVSHNNMLSAFPVIAPSPTFVLHTLTCAPASVLFGELRRQRSADVPSKFATKRCV